MNDCLWDGRRYDCPLGEESAEDSKISRHRAIRPHSDAPPSSIHRRKTRLLFVTPRYAPFVGGIETHVSEMGRRLVACGFEVTVATVDPKGTLPPSEMLEGVRVLRFPSYGADLYWSPALYRAVRTGRWDLVHCQGIHTLVPVATMAAAIRSRVPYLVTFHTGGHDSRLRRSVRWLQWMALAPLLRRAAAMVAVSRFERNLWHRVPGLRSRPIEIIPNGAEMPAPDPPLIPDRNLIVTVGRLVRYKGHQRAIAAFREVLKSRPHARLRIAGDGPYEATLRRAAARAGVARRTEIAGISGRDRESMARLLASAGVVLLLSEYEAHPVAVLEAASLGRPVVAADTTGLHELIVQGLARGVPLDASDQTLANTIVEELDSQPRPPVALPRWDDCAERLMERYRAILQQ